MRSVHGFVANAAASIVLTMVVLGPQWNTSVQAIEMPGVPELSLDDSIESHLLYLHNREFRKEVDQNTTITDSGVAQALERIVNGRSADREEYTYFCRNIVRSFGLLRYNCGCSYIADGWALTAAHCVTDSETGELLSDAFGATLGYFCGRADNCCDPSIADCPNFETLAGEYIVHPDYDIRSGLFDLALLKFNSMPQRNFEQVLPDDGFLTDSLERNNPVTAIGAGQVDNEALPAQGVLQELEMLYFPARDCARSYGRLSFGDAAVCAYIAGGLGGVCFGDSGGPLLVRQVTLESGEIRDVQIGVHSFISGTCERKARADVMASVAGGMPFIRGNVCENNVGDTRPYWCDGPVEAGSIQRQEPPQPPPQENQDEGELDGDGDVAPACNERRKVDRYMFNPILGRTKPCKHLRKKGLAQIFCQSPLSDAKQVCCETCEGITQQSA